MIRIRAASRVKTIVGRTEREGEEEEGGRGGREKDEEGKRLVNGGRTTAGVERGKKKRIDEAVFSLDPEPESSSALSSRG